MAKKISIIGVNISLIYFIKKDKETYTPPVAGKFLKSLDFIDKDKSVLLTAFNRDIVSVLEKKIKGVSNVTAITQSRT